MKLGIVFLLLAFGCFVWFGLARTFSDIWPFGVLLAVIAAVLIIFNHRNRKKYD
jgi:hypothetical protein